MADYFDSSVLIGVIFGDCPEHEICAKVWNISDHRAVYSHGLLETFCQLTGGRLGTPVLPDDAAESIALTVEQGQVSVIGFDLSELLKYMRESRKLGVRGGAVYDYMHLCAARKAGADRIFTLNKRHFMAIAPDLAPKIFHPADR
jgi:predicted nucleic acid-binding protein